MNTIIEKIRAEKIIRLIISILEDKHPNTFWRSNEMESGVYTEELVSFLSNLEKEYGEKPKKGLHSGSLRKVDNPMKWMEDDAKELTNPAVQEQPVDWQKIAEAHAKDQPLGQDNDGNLVYLQEQPVCEDVEMEIKETELEYQQRSERGEYPASIESICRRFYELGRHSKLKPSEGLEEEIYSFWDYFYGKDRRVTRATNIYDFGNIARHFAQWGAEHAKIDVTDFCKPIDPGIAQCIADHSWEMLGESEKPVPKDLEEAAVEYSAIGYSPFDDPYEKHQQFECSKFAFIAGAKWQKEQDEKELSEKIASAYQLGLADKEKQMMKEAVEGIVTTRSMAGNIVTAHIDHQFTNGQKVKLIIIQED